MSEAYRKFYASLVAVFGAALAAFLGIELDDGTLAGITGLVTALISSFLVRQVPNAPLDE